VTRRLVVWLEGRDDRRFFEAVVRPRLLQAHEMVLVREYRSLERSVTNRRMHAMSQDGFERLFVADMNAAPCVTRRKEKLKEHYRKLQDREILVVVSEIESWFLAGLTAEGVTALNVECPPSTDRLTKEEFDRLIPSRFDSRQDFLLELLQHFDLDTACRRNQSFAYFCRKFLA